MPDFFKKLLISFIIDSIIIVGGSLAHLTSQEILNYLIIANAVYIVGLIVYLVFGEKR